METTYEDLLLTKEKRIIDSGFSVNTNRNWLYPFQDFIVRRGLLAGRFAMFSDCGTGKSRMQLTWADEVSKHTNMPVIIFAPLAVVAQTIREADLIDLSCTEFVNDVLVTNGIYISNYEQLENIDCSVFSGVVLDEASIIKNHEGAYRNLLMDLFLQTPYKLCCTATPSPNDPMELGNYSEFLGAMPRSEMLAMYFIHDGGETSKWRLKGHCENIFWDFVCSWSIMLSKPSDIGFADEGYNLPELNYFEKVIVTDKKDNGQLFNDMAISATNHNAELRFTQMQRLDEVVDIVKSRPDESFIIWVKHNAEGDALRKLLPDAIEVKGADSPEYKKEKLLGFADNKFKILITKTKVAAMGLNFQNCHNMIFAAPDFSFEQLYQAIRREWRFGQLMPVNVWLLCTDTMSNIIPVIQRKQKQFETMQKSMRLSMNRSFNAAIKKEKRMDKIYKSDWADLRLGDSLQLVDTLEDESIGFSIWSPPFPELYVYSSELEDLGNCKDYNEFMNFFSFIPKKMFRVMQSGRNVAIHCMDTPIQKGKEGYIGLRDFSGMIIQKMQDAGFIYHSRVTIWKNPVTEMQRTKALGLLHKQVKKDAAMSRVGIPDYLLVFRKPGEHAHPVKCNISVDTWQQYASPVWMDIDYGNTLNGRNVKDEKDQKHICPLQIDTIKRGTILWSNEGDTCLSMFGGIGSEPATFIDLNRKAVAFELKTSYFDQMVNNVKASELLKGQTSIF